MKKSIIIGLVMLLACAALFVVGCGGGDTETAKKYMKTADTQMAAIQKQVDEMNKQQTEMSAAAMDPSSINVDPAMLANISAQIDAMQKEIDTCKASYNKMLDLEGCDDYVLYAKAQIAYLESLSKRIDLTKDLMASIGPLLQQVAQTKDMSVFMTWMSENQTMLNDFQKSQETSDALQKKAEKIKKDKKLGE